MIKGLKESKLEPKPERETETEDETEDENNYSMSDNVIKFKDF